MGDLVIGAFHPSWIDGPLTDQRLAVTPGDTEDGWLQQYVRFPSDALIVAPAHLSAAEAATLVCAGTTAWSALRKAEIATGDVVVTQGTGGVSLFAVQLAKAHGAIVIVTSSSDEKLEVAQSLGADHLINYRTSPDWHRSVRRLTDGVGADLVLDLGGQQTLAQSVSACRTDGKVAIIGVLSGFEPAQLPISDAMVRQITLFRCLGWQCRHTPGTLPRRDRQHDPPAHQPHLPLGSTRGSPSSPTRQRTHRQDRDNARMICTTGAEGADAGGDDLAAARRISRSIEPTFLVP